MRLQPKATTRAKPQHPECLLYKSGKFEPRNLEPYAVYQAITWPLYRLGSDEFPMQTILLPTGSIAAMMKAVRRDVLEHPGERLEPLHVWEVEGLDCILILSEADVDRALELFAPPSFGLDPNGQTTLF